MYFNNGFLRLLWFATSRDLVDKEIVLPRRWKSETGNLVIKGVDKIQIRTTYKLIMKLMLRVLAFRQSERINRWV